MTGSKTTFRKVADSFAMTLLIVALLSVELAGLIWLGITTAGTVEPYDADPVVIAMGVPSRG